VGEQELVDAFDQSALPAMRSDLFRYCALYLYGGIYVDVALISCGDVMELYDSCSKGLLLARERPFPTGTRNIANGFMIMKQSHTSLMLNLLRGAAFNATRKSSNNVWQVTGPYIATYLWQLCEWNNLDLFKDVTLMREVSLRKYVEFCEVAYRNEGMSWLNIQRNRSIFYEAAPTLTLIQPDSM
jgi:mannosyltransferase OCH1-like enzyme